MVSRFLCPTARILQVDVEALTGFCHILYTDGPNYILPSQGCIFQNGSHCGNGGQNVHSQDGEGMRSHYPGPALGSAVVTSYG